MLPKISIIVSAKNSESTLVKCVDSIINLEHKNSEFIIVNDGSTDKTLEILQKYSEKLQIISNSVSLGPSESRNLAANIAQGEYLAFTDADCIVDRNWLNQLMEGFERFPEAVACGGSQEMPEDASKFQKKVFLLMKKCGFLTEYTKSGSSIVVVSHNPSYNVMYKKDAFLQEKGFLDNLWPGEDVELDHRLSKKGYKLVFNPRAVVYHYKPETFKSFIHMMHRYGWAQGFLVKRYGLFRRIHFLPLGILIVLAVFLFSLFINLQLTAMGTALFLFFLWFYFGGDLQVLSLAFFSIIYWNAGFIKGFFNQIAN